MYKLSSIIFSLAVLIVPAISLAQEKIKIGVSTPLTGDAATYGIDVRNALVFANEKYAKNKYELVFEDDKCNGREAATVAHRLIGIVKVKYVLGFPCSGALLPSAPLYEKAKVVVIAAGASAVSISSAGDYIFRTWPSDALAVQVLYDYVSSKHKVLGVLSEETDYAQAFLNSLRSVNGDPANTDGKLRIESEEYISNEHDFRTMLLRIRSKGAQALLINSQTEATAAAILKDLKAMQWNVPLYNGFLAGSPSFLAIVGDLADGMIYPDYPSPQDFFNPEGRSILAEYNAQFGKLNSVEVILAAAVESFRALHAAIESGQDARSYLYHTKFDGIFGEWSFDQNGDIQGPKPVLKIIENQKPVLLSR